MASGATPERVNSVPVRILDSILTEAGTPIGFDFLSIDVEGHKIEVLRGFDIARWKPRLILLEDHVGKLSKHRYLLGGGYRIIRRYENNGWYVPHESAAKCRWTDRREIVRKILPGPAVSGLAQSFRADCASLSRLDIAPEGDACRRFPVLHLFVTFGVPIERAFEISERDGKPGPAVNEAKFEDVVFDE